MKGSRYCLPLGGRTIILSTLAVLLTGVAAGENKLQCATGWGMDVQDIPKEWINDGYCDCPLDGMDEPETNACAGSATWPGITTTTANNHHASASSSASSLQEASHDGRGSPSVPRTSFACPQQPKLLLPPSRLQDGICDCCDGTDERPGVCTDICEEVLRAEREARAKLEEAFKVGQNRRKHDLYAFKKLREEKLLRIQELEMKKEELNPQEPMEYANHLQLQYLKQRRGMTEAIVAEPSSSAMLAGVTPTELRTVIVLACQLAGEMASDDADTCAALRLAGLELGMIWKDDNFEAVDEMEAELVDASSLDLAKRLFVNAADGERKWNVKDNSRRRLDEDREYGVTDDEFDDDYEGHFDDDEYGLMEDDYYPDIPDDPPQEEKRPLDDLEGPRKEFVERVRALPFSATRNAFLGKSTDLLSKISEAMEQSKEIYEVEEDDEQGEDGENSAEDSEPPVTTKVDPAAYNMLRNNLRRKEKVVSKGFKWGASAMLFFAGNERVPEEQLLQLALYTIYHGNLGAVHAWQILQMALEDFATPAGSQDDETCGSPWAGYCPPTTIQRDGTVIPAPILLGAAEAFCAGEPEAVMQACSVGTADAYGIPTTIPEGYYGYLTPVPRDDKDPIATLFAPLSTLPVDKEGFERLEKEKTRLEKEKQSLDKDITNIWKEIGGKDGTAMGPNGELHALADKCFDVEAGKYIYEVCIFGQAKQKDGPKAGGTGLGKYTRMEYDEETGERVMYWENGQKCWNGPHRSATVYLTCGAENKLLSADEPDTCRYVMEMESYIACDEHFKHKMGL